MSAFAHLPLGQRIPASIHGVSCSIPTMRALVGYEEKDPEIIRHLPTGYPRFVQHPFLKQAAQHVTESHGLRVHDFWPTASASAAEKLRAHLAPAPARPLCHHGLHGVAFPRDPDTFAKAKVFLQHTGMLASSREAEDYLLRTGGLAAAQPELYFAGDALARVRSGVTQAFACEREDHVFLTNNGMNAVYGAFRAIGQLQAARGRRLWLQLGWLYRDTIGIIQNFTGNDARYQAAQYDVFDTTRLADLFAARGSEIAGIITEVPTNPLLQTADLPAIRSLCDRYGAALIIDPSTVSARNVNVLPYADLAVTSLTKYAASEGDLLMGAVVVNPNGQYAPELLSVVPGELEPVYSRDLARLAHEIGDFEQVVATINQTVPRVVDFLSGHPKVRQLYWSLAPQSRANFLKIARDPGAVGCMLSFTVNMPLDRFYDRLRLPKGPSFGMKTTLACPFIYLAHYDLVSSDSGRAFLQTCGIETDLIRLAIGCEPADDIIEALGEALAD